MTTSGPPALCVDCGQEIPDEQIFRVLRHDRAGRRHVICHTCSDRAHAAARPSPLQVHRTPPSRARMPTAGGSPHPPDARATVARWHRVLANGDLDGLMTLIHPDVEVGGPRGASRGAQALREWYGRAGVQLLARRYIGHGPTVVVEQDAEWRAASPADEGQRRRVASLFSVEAGLITRVIRFDTLQAALDAAGLRDTDGVAPDHLSP